LYEIAKEKKSARCGSWDMSFKLLTTPPPTVHKACKNVDFEYFHGFGFAGKNTQNSHFCTTNVQPEKTNKN